MIQVRENLGIEISQEYMLRFNEENGEVEVLNNFTKASLRFVPIGGFIVGETYTISCNVHKNDNYGNWIMKINQDGNSFSTFKPNDGIQSITFRCEHDSDMVFIYFGDQNTPNRKYKITEFKIEEGDQMTPYLPHKSNVKAENQAVFPVGGGYSKRYIHSSPRGGALC